MEKALFKLEVNRAFEAISLCSDEREETEQLPEEVSEIAKFMLHELASFFTM